MIETHTNQEPRKRTRAEVVRDSVHIRLATDECGPLIAEVLKENGIELPGADWSRVFPSWLVATVGDQVVGCVQVLPGKPTGFLEFLFTRKSAPFKLRVIAFRKLAEQGFMTLSMSGCSFVLGTVEPGNKAFLDILKKHNAIHAGSAELMARRVK